VKLIASQSTAAVLLFTPITSRHLANNTEIIVSRRQFDSSATGLGIVLENLSTDPQVTAIVFLPAAVS